jgi:drug/metabolite transporter (DMT)-like permease
VKSIKRLVDLFLLVVLCSFWGLAFVAIKIGLEYLSPVALTFLRFAVACLAFAAYFLLRRIPLPLSLIPRVAMLGFVGFTLYHLSLNLGETVTASGAASLVIATMPAFVVLFSRILLKERIGSLRAVGMVLGFLGLAAILVPTIEVSKNPLGVAAILPAPLSAALYTVLGKSYLRREEPAVLTGYAQSFGLLFLIPLLSDSTFLEVLTLPLRGWIVVLFLGIGSTALGYTVWYKILKVAEASVVGSYSYLVSLIAVLFGHLILSEPFTVNLVVGGVLVMAGVYLAHRY